MDSFKFHPIVARWFAAQFGSPTEPQLRGWPAIQSGSHTLIAAPTGSGKTLAAFFAELDLLFREALAGKLNDETRVVYVSPLKALSNDIHKNLEEPLAGIRAAKRVPTHTHLLQTKRRVSAFTVAQCAFEMSGRYDCPSRAPHAAWNISAASFTARTRFMRS